MNLIRHLVRLAFAGTALFAVVAVTIESVARLAPDSPAAVLGSGILALALAALALFRGPRVLEPLDAAGLRLAALPERRFLLLVVGIGLALRIVWLAFAGVTPTSDGSTYFELARRLLVDGEFRDPRGDRAYWPPGYPFFLLVLMHVFGATVQIVAIGNLLAFVLTLFGAWWLGRMLISPIAGRMAAVLIAVWPNLVLATASGSKEALMLAAITIAGCMYVYAVRAPAGLRMAAASFGSGLATGVATLTQPSILLFPFVFAGTELLGRAGKVHAAGRLLMVLAGMALVILPWTARNAAVLGTPVLVSTNGGDVFYRANNPLATGGYIAKGPVDLRQYGELERGEVGYRLAREWIRDNPQAFVRLMLDKQLIFLGDNANAVFDVLKRRQGENSTTYIALKGMSNLFWLGLWLVVLAGWRRVGRSVVASPAALLPLAFLYVFLLDSVFESGSRHHVPVAGFLAVLVATCCSPLAKPDVVFSHRVSAGRLPADSLGSQFLRFASVGVVGTAAHYIVLAGLVELMGAGAVIASAAGFVVGAAVNYVLNYRLTFRSNEKHVVAAPKFLAVVAVGFVVNGVVMAVGTGAAGLHYFVAQILATGAALVWNFVGNRAWTFRGGVA